MVKWHENYAENGLVVIEVDNGAIDPLPAVRQWIASERIPFPVLYDSGGTACRSYGVSSYPAQYLIGRDGKVVWQGGAWWDGAVPAIEAQIRAALGGGKDTESSR